MTGPRRARARGKGGCVNDPLNWAGDTARQAFHKFGEAQRAHDNASPPAEPIMLCRVCGRWRCETDMARNAPERCADCDDAKRIEVERDDALRLAEDLREENRKLHNLLNAARETLQAHDAKTNPNAGLHKSTGRWDGPAKAL